jgi:hypothetical protein
MSRVGFIDYLSIPPPWLALLAFPPRKGEGSDRARALTSNFYFRFDIFSIRFVIMLQ